MVLELKYILIYNLFNFLKTEVYFYIYYKSFLSKCCLSNNIFYTNSFYLII
ncbi:hypothetical protein HanRHA438_Chr05g0217941 [Helianthus annuus]|nr:hypothetical protein HanRHA438_Chr05g0217941 [Helianthus annuus]